MGLARGSRWIVWGGLAALLYAGLAHPDVKAALARLDASATLASSHASLVGPDLRSALSHGDAALTGPELDAARLDPDASDALADPVEHVALAKPDVDERSLKASDECLLAEDCIDQYLWSVYERARKVDSIKVTERIKVTVTKKGKSRTVTRTVSKVVDEDFTWKDPQAAQKAGMSMMQYVIGGMDLNFKGRLYHLFRTLDEAGLAPGMTSGFRDDYRQSIASGNKAATNRSYHGGSLRGGYGHGLAADVVSTKGETRAERWISTEAMWKWIDANGKDFGIGRPYLDRDPPHIAPIDGQEYADKRGVKRTARAN
jgi:hypothetical protein